jgi:hypothetical protein
MNFYRISSWAIGGPLYPWAAGYGALPEMPFIQELQLDFRNSMVGFWKVNPRKPGMDIDPKGKVWSDFVGNGLGNPSYFVSDKVITDLEANGIEVWRKTAMPIASNASKRLSKLLAPGYFVLEAERGIDADFMASGVPLDAHGNPLMRQRSPQQSGPLVMNLNSWNGKDLVTFRNWGDTMTVACTERVKKLSGEKGWTNVQFTPLPVI